MAGPSQQMQAGAVVSLGETCNCLSLTQARNKPNLESLKEFFTEWEDAAIGWIDAFEITSPKACSCGQLDIVKRLLLDEMTKPDQMLDETIEDKKFRQSLALDIAAGSGDLETVTKLCEATPELLDQNKTVHKGLPMIPVVRASNAGHKEVTRYLYNNQKALQPDLIDQLGLYWATRLLLDAIFYGFIDIASDIFDQLLPLGLQSLAVTKQPDQRSAPLRVLALKPDLFRPGFWQSIIHSGIKLNDIYSKAKELLTNICKKIKEMAGAEGRKEMLYEALLEAVENGNKKVFIEIIKCDRQLLWILEKTSGRNLFQLAVKFKKEKIFNLIHGLDDIKVTLLRSSDKENNNILHIAAHLSTPAQLSKISGAALKMQRDAQWYNEVKSLVSEREVVQKNNDNKTPRQVFEDSHEPLRKEGEEWMKYTATACSLVAALIATVTFQAIFTEPGGTDETSGKPLLLNDGHFLTFIIIDSLAFYASCISILIFLSILTSRYSFDDFIVSLPRKMILGLSILFFSIAAMLVAFITALSASMRERRMLVVPMKPLASIPAIIFLMLQYPLLKEMISSTYCKGFFRRNTKSWLPVDDTQGDDTQGPGQIQQNV